MASRTLTPLERRLLAFEASWENRITGSKEAAIRAEFGWRPIAYEQKLQATLREPAALQLDAGLVHRALDRRDRLVRERAGRRLVSA